MAERSPDFVPLEEALRRRAGLSATTNQMGDMISRAYRAVAEPVTAAVGYGLRALSTIDQPMVLPGPQHGLSPGPEGERLRERGSQLIAETVIPQTPTELAIQVGTMGGAGVAAKLGLRGTKAAMARVGGGGLGGLVGGAGEGRPLEGTAQGLVGTTIGEGVGATAKLVRGLGARRVTAKVHADDAARWGKVLGDTPQLRHLDTGEPLFAGAKTPKDLRQLAVSGRGHEILGEQQELAMKQIHAHVRQARANRGLGPEDPLVRSPFSLTESSSVVLGGTMRLPPPAAVPGMGAPVRGATPTLGGYAVSGPVEPSAFLLSSPPQRVAGIRYIPLAEARNELKLLYEAAYRGKQANPATATPSGADPKKVYEQATKAFSEDLQRLDPTMMAAKIFDDAQDQFRVGRTLLDLTARGFKGGKRADIVDFNSPSIQSYLSDFERMLRKKIGTVYDQLATAVRLKTPGMADEAVGSASAGRLFERLPGGVYIAAHPSFNLHLVGDPMALSPLSRLGIDLGANIGVAKGLEGLRQGPSSFSLPNPLAVPSRE